MSVENTGVYKPIHSFRPPNNEPVAIRYNIPEYRMPTTEMFYNHNLNYLFGNQVKPPKTTGPAGPTDAYFEFLARSRQDMVDKMASQKKNSNGSSESEAKSQEPENEEQDTGDFTEDFNPDDTENDEFTDLNADEKSIMNDDDLNFNSEATSKHVDVVEPVSEQEVPEIVEAHQPTTPQEPVVNSTPAAANDVLKPIPLDYYEKYFNMQTMQMAQMMHHQALAYSPKTVAVPAPTTAQPAVAPAVVTQSPPPPAPTPKVEKQIVQVILEAKPESVSAKPPTEPVGTPRQHHFERRARPLPISENQKISELIQLQQHLLTPPPPESPVDSPIDPLRSQARFASQVQPVALVSSRSQSLDRHDANMQKSQILNYSVLSHRQRQQIDAASIQAAGSNILESHQIPVSRQYQNLENLNNANNSRNQYVQNQVERTRTRSQDPTPQYIPQQHVQQNINQQQQMYDIHQYSQQQQLQAMKQQPISLMHPHQLQQRNVQQQPQQVILQAIPHEKQRGVERLQPYTYVLPEYLEIETQPEVLDSRQPIQVIHSQVPVFQSLPTYSFVQPAESQPPRTQILVQHVNTKPPIPPIKSIQNQQNFGPEMHPPRTQNVQLPEGNPIKIYAQQPRLPPPNAAQNEALSRASYVESPANVQKRLISPNLLPLINRAQASTQMTNRPLTSRPNEFIGERQHHQQQFVNPSHLQQQQLQQHQHHHRNHSQEPVHYGDRIGHPQQHHDSLKTSQAVNIPPPSTSTSIADSVIATSTYSQAPAHNQPIPVQHSRAPQAPISNLEHRPQVQVNLASVRQVSQTPPPPPPTTVRKLLNISANHTESESTSPAPTSKTPVPSKANSLEANPTISGGSGASTSSAETYDPQFYFNYMNPDEIEKEFKTRYLDVYKLSETQYAMMSDFYKKKRDGIYLRTTSISKLLIQSFKHRREVKASEEDINRALLTVDVDNDGMIDLDEFINLLVLFFTSKHNILERLERILNGRTFTHRVHGTLSNEEAVSYSEFLYLFYGVPSEKQIFTFPDFQSYGDFCKQIAPILKPYLFVKWDAK